MTAIQKKIEIEQVLTGQHASHLRRLAVSGSIADAETALAGAVGAGQIEPAVVAAQGVIAYRKGRYQEAAIRLSESLKNDESDTEALLYLVRSLYNLGDNASCRHAAQQYLSRVPGTVDVLRMLARVAQREGDLVAAEEAWRELARVKADDAEAPLQLARLLIRRGDAAGAMEQGGKASTLNPAAAEPLTIQGGAAAQLKQYSAMPEILARLAKLDAGRASSMLRDLGRVRAPEAASACGRAIAAMRKAGVENAEFTAIAAELIKQWRLEAIRAELARDDHAAIGVLRALLDCEADDPSVTAAAARLRGYAVADLRSASRANDQAAIVAAADRVVELDPGAMDAWLAKGRALLAMGDNEHATGPLEKAVALAPDNGWCALNLARALWRWRRDARTAELARHALNHTEGLTPEHIKELHQLRESAVSHMVQDGSRLLRERNLRGALDLAAALDRNNQAEAGQSIRTVALQQLFKEVKRGFRENAAETRELADLYLREDPGNTEVQVVFGRLSMAAGAYKPALAVWRALAEAQPLNAHFALQIARCHQRSGQHREAIEAARQVLLRDPSMTEATDIIQRSTALIAPGGEQTTA